MNANTTAEKIVGYDVRITFRDGTTKTLRKKGTQKTVNLWAMLKTNHVSHEFYGTYTHAQWVSVWGQGRM